MKRIMSVLIACLVMLSIKTSAQSKAQKFTVSGIQVIIKPTVKDIINVSVYYRGGVADYKADEAGIGNLALSGATECGTKKYTKDAFKDKADEYGISIYGSGTYDYGNISLNCISNYFDEAWDLLTEAIINPVYNEKEFDLMKEKVLSGIKQQESDPDSKITKMAIDNTFKGTVYETDPNGTINSVSKLTAANAKAYYYDKLLNKNKMFIVVVGKISKEDITARIKKAFSGLPSNPYINPVYKAPVITSNTINIVPRKLSTNYIIGVFNAPAFTSNDFVANRLALVTFSMNLFTEIRTKKNLSYAPYAYTASQQMPYSIMYVSTTNTAASVRVMVDEIKRLKTQGFSQKEFNDSRNLFITGNYMKQESTNAMAASLGSAEVLGDWKMSEEFIDKVQKTTPADMTKIFQTYVQGINWNYLGDEKSAENAKTAFDATVN